MDRRFSPFYLLLTTLFVVVSLVDILDGKAPQIVASICLATAFFLLYLHTRRPRVLLRKLAYALIAAAIALTFYRLIMHYYVDA